MMSSSLLMPSGATLLGTPEANAWLSSMPLIHRDAAQEALGELRLVSEDSFEFGVRELIGGIQSQSVAPVALYCVRDVLKDIDGLPVSYHDGNTPERVRSDEPGSDWRIAHFLYKGRSDKQLDHPTIDDLRNKKVRDIIFVDDVSMSGTNLGNFLSSFHRNYTIASWYSHRLINYHVVIHTIGWGALDGMYKQLAKARCKQLTRRRPIIHMRREEEGPYSDSSVAFFEDTRHLLSNNHRRHPNGFKGSQGKTIFAHGCPNNVPPIFWDSQGSFSALFPNRSVPPSLLPLFRGENVEHNNVIRTNVLDFGEQLVLRCILAGARNRRTVAGRTGMDLQTSARILERLRRLQLIDEDGRLTEDGKIAADVATKKVALPTLVPPSKFYYPRRRGDQ